jgi:hypothetical protein
MNNPQRHLTKFPTLHLLGLVKDAVRNAGQTIQSVLFYLFSINCHLRVTGADMIRHK